MWESYRRVLGLPGGWQFSSAGLLARLPISMMTLGIVVLVSTTSGSYALAGQVSAAYIVGNAAFAIVQGRLTDRFGQRRLLYADTALFAAATLLLVVAIDSDAVAPWPHLAALASGMALPQVGTMVRARWTLLVPDDATRHTAFAVEAVADEMVFVTGPALVAWTATGWRPDAGLLIAVVAGTVGTMLLAGQRRTEPPVHPAASEARSGRLHRGSLGPMAAGAAFLGSVFGALEVATVAFAEDLGHKPLSGLLLALFAGGSLVAGVVTGAIPWKVGPLQRARAGLGLLTVGCLVLPFAPGFWSVGALLLVSGLSLAPTLIALFSLVESTTPAGRLNEAMAFIQTGVALGIAPGSWLAGVVADHGGRDGGSEAYWVCAASAVIAALTSLVLRLPVSPRPDPAPRATA